MIPASSLPTLILTKHPILKTGSGNGGTKPMRPKAHTSHSRFERQLVFLNQNPILNGSNLGLYMDKL
jgi:hypothetical protein